MTNEELKRYSRHITLSEIGKEGQLKLKHASVFVIGAGGLGCPVLQYLAAAGVGRIGIADHDVVDESNLQRQVLYTVTDVGLSKADQAKKKLQALNPYILIEAYPVKVNRENILSLLKEYDIVVDGSDNFATRYLVNDACVMLNKPLVFGSIFKFEGQVTVFNYKDGPTYRCLYPTPPKDGEVPNCSEIGVIGVLPGIVGALQANEVIKIITGIGEVLKGKLLMFDALSVNFNTLSFKLQAENKKITELIDYDIFCGVNKTSVKEITAPELMQKIYSEEKFQIIDVRTIEEYEGFNIGGILIPWEEVENNIDLISKEEEVIFVCQSGKRSEAAIKALEGRYSLRNLYNLKGGLNNW